MAKKKIKTGGIFIGLIVGTVLAIIANYSANTEIISFINKNIAGPVGSIFLNALKMIIIPLVLSSLAVGVADIGDPKKLGFLGLRTLLFYLCTTLTAIVIGQTMVNVFEPGSGIDQSVKETLLVEYQETAQTKITKSGGVKDALWPTFFINIVPKNIIQSMVNGDMLSIIFIALFMGVALLMLPKSQASPLHNFFNSLCEVSLFMIGAIMKIAPFAVACLMFSAVTKFGTDILLHLGKYVGVVISSYILQFVLVYFSILYFFLKISPLEFLRKASPIFSTAFSTSSSSATMPTTIATLGTNFKVPRKITSFCVPLGATVNMDGTAMFECIAAIFIAQVFGVDLDLSSQLILIFLILFSSIGVAGVPGGSIPLLISAMVYVGVPAEGIALILGVDRLLDMGRTVVNVTGDTVGALAVHKMSQKKGLF